MKLATRDTIVTVEGRAAAYTLRVPTKRDRIELARRVRAAGGQQHGPHALFARVRATLAAAFAEDAAERERLLGIVSRYQAEYARLLGRLGEQFRDLVRFAARVAAGSARLEDMPPALKALDAEAEAFAPLRAQYLAIEALCEPLDPALREMQAANAVYGAIYNMEAAGLLLTGWTANAGWPLPDFARGRDRVPDAVLEALPDEDIAAIGDKAFYAEGPTEAERKNSVSPHGTSPGGAATPTDASTGPPTAPLPLAPAESLPTAG